MATKPMKTLKLPGLEDTYTFLQNDATLTQSGKAADAKATGDKISDLKSAFNNSIFIPSVGHTIIQGTYNSSGAVSQNPARIRVDGFLEVKNGASIKFSAGTNTTGMLVGFFSTEKRYLSEMWYEDGAIVKVYSDGYIILVFRKNVNNDNITPSEYDAKTQIVPSIWNEIGRTNDYAQKYVVSRTRNLIDRDSIRVGYLFAQSSSSYILSSNWISTDYIPVETQKVYKFSYNSGTNGTINQLQGLDENKQFVMQITASAGGFTVPQNTPEIKYIVICSNNASTKAGVDTWQLEEGETATAFVPYYAPKYQESIVQETGSDESKVMSQKAVTDLFSGQSMVKSLSLPLFLPKKIRFLMHRGFSFFSESYTPENARPENTVPAFEQAAIAGAFGIETDVRETSDGVLVLMHDATVDRTTNGSGYVKTMTYAQLQELTIDYGANVAIYNDLKVPTLAEYLQVCAQYGCVPFIEIMDITDYSKLFSQIRQFGLEDSCVIVCTQSGSIENVRAITNKVPIFVNARNGEDFDAVIETCKAYENVIIGFQRNADPVLTSNQVLECHENGIAVCSWTFNYAIQLNDFLPLGIDLITCELLPLR